MKKFLVENAGEEEKGGKKFGEINKCRYLCAGKMPRKV